MRRGDLASLSAFAAVAEQLSFRVAAARLGVTPSALSRTIRELEARVGVRLLNRTTRSVSLTDGGRELLDRVQPALDQVEGALEGLRQRLPVGRLRLYATHLASVAVIDPMWRRFLATYTEIHLELEIGERAVDLIALGCDAGLSPLHRVPPRMTTVPVLGPMKAAVVGAPSYFAQRPPPRSPDDLARHNCILFRRDNTSPVAQWTFQRKGGVRRLSVDGRLTVNSAELNVRAAVAGLGVAYTFEPHVEPYLRSGRLVRVLEDWSRTIDGLFLYYPSQRPVSPALTAFIEMVTAERRRDRVEAL